MRLPSSDLNFDAQLKEFDVWITPSLGEIQDTEKFKKAMEDIIQTLEVIGEVTDSFSDEADCSANTLAERFVNFIQDCNSFEDAYQVLISLASTLFLVTGKSDNNNKCQFPLYLRDQGWETIHYIKRTGRKNIKVELANKPLPRELNAKKYMEYIASFADPDNRQLIPFDKLHPHRLLTEFIGFLLSDEAYVTQLWSVGRSYFMLKEIKKERAILTPLIVFQVRGSVSASGGHNPETLLRERLVEWGLQEDVDFNISDVVPQSSQGETVLVELEDSSDETESGEQNKRKTRGYDFVLPYKTDGWIPHLFIQCQFYAGDSGSVSHKNVDQTDNSRPRVQELYHSAIFIEYVDGAGYFSSLNGDLKRLLRFKTTKTFVQVRSLPIRLRRELQQIGFLIPIEIEHAILRLTQPTPQEVHDLLVREGYNSEEVKRCLQKSLTEGLIPVSSSGEVSISSNRKDIVRRYFLLDVAALYGSIPSENQIRGFFLIPGYGAFYGMKLDELARKAIELSPRLAQDLSDPTTILTDIRWLCERGWAMSR
jgi:hypothetical protein